MSQLKGISFAAVEHNINIFCQLKENEKIIINQNDFIAVDNRYLQSLRRKLDWWIWSCESSRQATYKIINETYESLKNYTFYDSLNNNIIHQSLDNLNNKMKIIYPNYISLFQLIDSYKQYYFKNKMIDKIILTPSNMLLYYMIALEQIELSQ